MDQRTTLKANEKFDTLLQKIKDNNERARLLYDDGGLQRAEGLIREMDLKAKSPLIVLDNDQKISIESIIGVNGIFTEDYTEC